MLTVTQRPEVRTLADSLVSSAVGVTTLIELHTSEGVIKVRITSLTVTKSRNILVSGIRVEDNGDVRRFTGFFFHQNTTPPLNDYGWIHYV